MCAGILLIYSGFEFMHVLLVYIGHVCAMFRIFHKPGLIDVFWQTNLNMSSHIYCVYSVCACV